MAASVASGFSQTTCLPAARAASARPAWRWFGVQMWTTSTSGLATIASARRRPAPRRGGGRRPGPVGLDAATPTRRAPARRTARAWTSPMNPAPATTARNGRPAPSSRLAPAPGSVSVVSPTAVILDTHLCRLSIKSSSSCERNKAHFGSLTRASDAGLLGRRERRSPPNPGGRRCGGGGHPPARPQWAGHHPSRSGRAHRPRPVHRRPAGRRPAGPRPARTARRQPVHRRTPAHRAGVQRERRRRAERRPRGHPLARGRHRPGRHRARPGPARDRHRRGARRRARLARDRLRPPARRDRARPPAPCAASAWACPAPSSSPPGAR